MSNNRITELENLITRYQASYYNGEGEISDADFDALWDELKSLDPSNAVLHRVGTDSGTFPKARHVMPMGSQEKAAADEEFLTWTAKHQYNEYIVEYKLDGASLELQYERGKLMRAVTRGDGTVGDDITANALKFGGVVKTLKGGFDTLSALNHQFNNVDFTGGVRGEVIMTHQTHDKYYSDKANCRNAANGLMKRKDGTGSEHLVLITYDAWTDGDAPFDDEVEKVEWLKAQGFNTVPVKVCNSPQEVIDYRKEVAAMRAKLDYDIDGLVVKERRIDRADAMRARPERQIAFKFDLQEAVTTVRAVEWSQNGGTYTPVAVFDEVSLAGTMVKRASMGNPDVMRQLGVEIGSSIVVVKRGEIIPKVMKVLPFRHCEQREAISSKAARCVGKGQVSTTPVPYPTVCETCGTTLVDEGSRLFCPNKSCPKRVLHQLLKWISVVDIRDMGETLVTDMFKAGVLSSITGIYSLTEEVLAPFFLNEESLGKDKKSLGAAKVAASINAHRRVSLAAFIGGFDIEGIGETMAGKLVDAGYGTLEKLLTATADEFAAVYGFADTMARIAVEGLGENAAEMRALVNSGAVTITDTAAGKLAGKSFCFTGELHTMKRADAEALVKQHGGAAKSSVTKDLSFLVTNDKASGSSKNAKAAKWGIPVIDEEEFRKMVGE